MEKSKKIITTVFTVARILSKVVFVLCLVGAVLCLVGIPALLIGAGLGDLITIGDLTIRGFIEENADMTVIEMVLAMLYGMIGASASAVVAKFGDKCFTKQLEVGDPFTPDCAKSMMRLGIAAIAAPIASVIVAGIVGAIFTLVNPICESVTYNGAVGIGAGVVILFVAVLMRYGAERLGKTGENPTDETGEQ